MFKKILIGACFAVMLAVGSSKSYAKPIEDNNIQKLEIGEAIKIENKELIESISITSPDDRLVTSEQSVLVSGKAKAGMKVLIQAYRYENEENENQIDSLLNLDKKVEGENVNDVEENVTNVIKEEQGKEVAKKDNADVKEDSKAKESVTSQEGEAQFKILDENDNEINIDQLENKEEILRNIQEANKIISKSLEVKELGIFTDEIDLETGNIKIIVFVKDSEGNVLKAIIRNITVVDKEKAKEFIDALKNNTVTNSAQENHN